MTIQEKWPVQRNGNKIGGVTTLSKIFSFSLYFTSFLPLWISVIIIDVISCIQDKTNLCTEYISIVCIVVVLLLCTFVIWYVLCKNNEDGIHTYSLVEAQEEKTISAEYLLSYILPLFAFDFTIWNQVLLFLVFFLTLAFLCIKHNHFTVNIILDIINYKFYKCVLKSTDNVTTEKIVLSRRELNINKGEDIKLKSLNNEYKLDVT